MNTLIFSCPYCRSNKTKLMVSEKPCGHNGLDDVVFRHKAYMRCLSCNARGPLASGKVMFVSYELPKWAEDPFEINQKAIDGWNKAYRFIRQF